MIINLNKWIYKVLMIKPVMAKRWLHPDFSWVICLSEIAPLISCGLAKLWTQCSGGLPHCPCWFEPQQKTCPEAVNAAEWWDPATTCTNFWEQSGILTVYDRKTYIRNVCYVLNYVSLHLGLMIPLMSNSGQREIPKNSKVFLQNL